MYKDCVPYKRKTIYILLTLPLLVLFATVAVYLWGLNTIAFTVYCLLIIIAVLSQSYCCAYQSCPYIGRFCPGIGGILILSSVIALALKNVKRVPFLFNLFMTLAIGCFLGVIIFPMFFIYKEGFLLLTAYTVLSIGYLFLFFRLVCPACATRDTCPGGMASEKMFHTN